MQSVCAHCVRIPRVQRVSAAVFNGTWRACRERVVARGGLAPACAREGVSTLGELPFRAGNNGMRVAVSSLAAWRFAAAPLQNGCGKDGDGGFFPSFSWLASFVNTLKGGAENESVSPRV